MLRQRTRAVRGTHVLVAVNVTVFAAVAFTSGSVITFPARHLIAWGADFGPRTTNGEWWRLVTATFLHSGLPHVILNMLGLLMIGPVVERLVGTRAFVAFYIACGLAASAASLWTHPMVVAVGASGAIMGMYGLLVTLMLDRRSSAVRAAEGAGGAPIRRAQLQIHLHPAVGFIVQTLALGWLVPNINNAAHAGGLAAGCLIGWTAGRDIEWTTPRRRELGTALALTLACCGIALAATGRVNDVRPAMYRVFEEDSRIGLLYSSAIASKAGPTHLSTVIESEILPALAAERRNLASVGRVAPLQQPVLDDLRQYVALREEAWRHRARSLREQRADLDGRSTELDHEADVVMRRLLRARF